MEIRTLLNEEELSIGSPSENEQQLLGKEKAVIVESNLVVEVYPLETMTMVVDHGIVPE